MKYRIIFICTSLLFIFSSFTLEETPDIEGTYQLLTRKLADGTRVNSPDIAGLATFTGTHRNFSVAWKDKNGKYFSYSVASEYKLTSTEYTEKIILSVMSDEITGKGVTYTIAGQSATVPVKNSDGKYEIQMPFDPVTIVFNGDRFTASNGSYTDYWAKITE